MSATRTDVAPMSVEQAAALLQVSRDTVIRFWDDRYTPRNLQLRAHKSAAGEWQIARADLATWVNARSITPAGEPPIRTAAQDMDRTYSLDQVAGDAGIPLWWLQKAVRAGRIHHIKVGKARRLTPAQVARAVQLRQISAADAAAVA